MPDTLSLTEIARDIGANVAAPVADEVDRDSRFPHEAAAALRERGMLAALVPRELGGPGATVAEVADAIRELSNHCSATALVLAMHSQEMANLVRFGTTTRQRELLAEVVTDPLLFTSANSEVGIGGELGRNRCAVETVHGRLSLTKDALAISFGEYADVVVGTARRAPDAADTDVVEVILRRPTLEPLSGWDAMGLRGTCSRSFRVVGDVDPELIYPISFAEMASGGALHSTQLFLSAVWVGIAEALGAIAHASVRAAARRSIGTLPPSAMRLSELSARLDETRSHLELSGQRYERAFGAGELEDAHLLAVLRALKVTTSRRAVEIATMAMEICGIAGYKRDTPYSLDWRVRDAFGGVVMVSNDRYLRLNAEMLAIRKRL